MSRHRNVRALRYSDEYDDEDVYGHSVEDDYSLSPTEESFLYDRNKKTQISSFLDPSLEEEEEEPEEEEVEEENAHPPLSDLEEAQLRSCLDKIRDIVGDSVQDSVLVSTILNNAFDVDKSLDQILSSHSGNQSTSSASVIDAPKPQRVRTLRTTIATDSDVAKSDVLPTSSASTVSLDPPTVVTSSNLTSETSSKLQGFANHVTSLAKSQKGGSGLTVSTPATPRSQSPCNQTTTTRSQPGTPRVVSQPGSPRVARSRSPSKPSSSRASPTPEHENSRSISNKLKKIEEYKQERLTGKGHLHLVVIGHVDAGKSTLMGHLLYKLGHVSQKVMHKYEQESKKVGKQSFVYAWILDETGEERNRGITMDVGQSKFETKTKSITLLDAPGHKDFIPNMITGATQADVALLVVDATRGEFETGFESGGQTREHALLVRSLGVNQLGVVINKLDTVAWSESRFLEITQKLGTFLKQAGFRESDIVYVPCSGLTGENLVVSSQEDALTAWYKGPCLLDVIDNFKCPERPISKALRMSVNDIYKSTGSGFCVSGRVETGIIEAGDKVLVLPQNEGALVKAVYMDEANVGTGYAGDTVSVTLSNFDLQNISVGHILSEVSSPCPVSSKFEARIVVFNITTPITIGYPVVLHQQSLVESSVITRLLSQVHKTTGEVLKKKPRCLTKNISALVVIETSRPICVELYRDVKELGRFMLRVSGITIAAGLVTKIY